MLRNPLLVAVILAAFFPAYSIYYIFPQFNHQLIQYTEDMSVRVATHLKGPLFSHGESLTEQSFNPAVKSEILKIMKDLRIEKIKTFSNTGIVLFSSDQEDIGRKNIHEYFQTRVAQGDIFSNVVKKGTKTMEGQIAQIEVVETYVPLMQDGVFLGAVEIYYDITRNSGMTRALLNSLKLIICVFSIIVAAGLVIVLFRASRTNLVKQKAEADLKNAHSELEKIVAERTMDLEKTNRSLVREIEERKNTQASLQQSNDTQTVINKLMKEALGNNPVQNVIDTCLNLVLSLPWLSLEGKGCIYLVEDKPDVLVLKAHKGLSLNRQQVCKTIPFGKCLCGLAAKKQQTIFANHIDKRHDILFPDTPDHGHYCIPVIARERTLGILNIYVKPGHKQNELEENFLRTVANTLAGLLVQRYSENQQRETEKKLLQSQKMEAIGTLAGGISHDFNNILSVILGHAQLIQMSLDDSPDKARNHIIQIMKGAQRATDLIRQILTFSRQTEHVKKTIQPYLIVKETIKFLRSSIPADIKIIENITSKAKIKADPTQIHQIVMNLCTNAYHAMKETGGELIISLSDFQSKNTNTVPDIDLKPGSYIKLEICDTGQGMSETTLNKIFEPYFTTKKIGEGTGLGLSVVHGIVEEHAGYIKVYSRIGRGTSFHIYFPAVADDRHSNYPETKTNIAGGNERIMIVDDEKSILDYLSEFLMNYGYRAIAFSDAGSALETFKNETDRFDLIITDMAMPDMSGDTFSKNILAARPDIPIVLCTGYSHKLTKEDALNIGIKAFFQKPVEGKELLDTIRTLLDQSDET